jgi:hypothetical protein
MSSLGNKLGDAFVELHLSDAKVPADLKNFRDKVMAGQNLAPKVDFLNALPSRYRAVADQTTSAIEKLKEWRRLSLGGQQNLGGFDKYHAENLRRQQGAALGGEVEGGQTQKLAALQQSIALEKIRAQYAASPEGAKALSEEVKLQGELNAAQAQRDRGGKLAALQQSIVLEKQRLRYAASPEGAKAIREEVKLQKELNTATRASGFAERTAEVGRFQAALEMANAQLAQVGGVAATAFIGGTAAIGGFVAAASPNALATFKASVEGVAISIGGPFIGYLDSASLGLQRLSRWIQALDPDLKRTAAHFVLTSVGVAGLSYAGIQLISTIGGIVKGLKYLQATFFLTPLGVAAVAIAGLTTAVAALGAAYWATGDKAKYMHDAANQPLRPVLPGNLRKVDLSKLPENVRRNAAGPGGLESALKQHEGDMAKALETLKATRSTPMANVEEKQRQADRVVNKGKDELSQLPARLEEYMSRNSKLYDTDKQRNVARVAYGDEYKNRVREETLGGVRKQFPGATPAQVELALTGGVPVRFAPKSGVASDEALKRAEDRLKEAQTMLAKGGMQGDGEEGPKRSLAGMPSPAFMSFQEYGDKLQMAGLQADTQEADNWKEQIKLLGQIGGLLKEIKDNSAGWRHYGPDFAGG